MTADDLVLRYSAPVPRYTSYPTAPHFTDAVDEDSYRSWLAGTDRAKPVSVYIHIPFCDKLCWFCGCHTKHTTRYEPIASYMEILGREIELVADALGFAPEIERLHLGGGSPSLVKPPDMRRLRDQLEAAFRFSPKSEISIEIDPSDATEALYEALATLGVTRASIGVQDFNRDVQKAINRPQGFPLTRNVVERLRDIGIGSVNIDALYGLPHQTPETLADTIEKVISLEADRIALFGYAHVPWMKKHQKLIDEKQLPGILERFGQARLAERLLADAGYDQIGIDHFARPGDSLAVAAAGGRVHRNFQGYTEDDCETLIGLGASSIGRTVSGYVQNIPASGQYSARVSEGRLPVGRGIRLGSDDIVRGKFIERLMCDFRVDLDAFRDDYGAEGAVIAKEAEAAARGDADGLCLLRDNWFCVPNPARPFVRTVASWFDAYMENSRARYSVAV